MILGFTNCSIDLVDDVCVVVVVVFNLVVVVVVVVEGISKFFSFLVLNNFELGFLESCPSFPSNNPKKYTPNATTKGDGNILRIRGNHESDFETVPFMSSGRYEQRGT